MPQVRAALLLLFSAVILLVPKPAAAIPSFAQQTGMPCSACHVGAFGPQLKPYGRDFKLFGYQSDDGMNHEPALAAMLQTSVTHTATDQSPPPAPHFSANDNFAVDQISLFYGGKAPMGLGVFAQVTYSGIDRAFSLDNFDVRRAKEVTLFGKDAVIALDFNNNPTVEDAWNTTPAWGFPYNSSALAPGAPAAALVDGGLGGQAVSGGAYLLWNDAIYVEAASYFPLERQFAGRLGEGVDGSSDRYSGAIPYGRVAVLHDFGTKATAELGAYGLRARRYPGGDVGQGLATISDWAVDGTYQYIGSSRHVVSAHATYIHEDQDLHASSVLSGTRPKNWLSTVRADVSYSYADTLTPSVQAFSTTGSTDPALYSLGLKTSGYVAELAYAPYGKPDSPLYWVNARLALQYVAYTEFNGARRGASDNNTLYLNLWVALAPFGSRVHR